METPHARIGTIGLELVSQVKDLTDGADLDAVIVTIGGGGLISGVTTAVKALCPNARIIGAQPEKAADAFKSKQSGTLCSPAGGEPLPDTIADGLRTSLGTKAWPVVRCVGGRTLVSQGTKSVPAGRCWQHGVLFGGLSFFGGAAAGGPGYTKSTAGKLLTSSRNVNRPPSLLTTRPPEDGALFPQEDRSPMTDRSFLLCQWWLQSAFPRPVSNASLVVCSAS